MVDKLERLPELVESEQGIEWQTKRPYIRIPKQYWEVIEKVIDTLGWKDREFWSALMIWLIEYGKLEEFIKDLGKTKLEQVEEVMSKILEDMKKHDGK